MYMAALSAAAALTLMTGIAHAMAVMVRATGQYNYSCSGFVEGKPAERAAALAFAQIYAAAENMNLDSDAQVNLNVRWRDLVPSHFTTAAHVSRDCICGGTSVQTGHRQ
jgi:hypothetical protein